MSQQSFVAQMSPFAKEASAATGIDANVIMAQWGIETGWGSSYQWTQHFNPAGIGITGPSVQGQNYGSVQGGVQAYVDFINNNSRYQAVKAAQGPTAQAIAMGNSGWAASGYNSGGGNGSALLSTMSSLGVNVDQAQAAAGGVTANVAGSATPNGAATATASASPTTNFNIPGVGTVGATAQQANALTTLENNLQQYGFTPDQLNGPNGLVNWAWGEVTNNVDPTQIAIDLQTQPAFIQQFPGFAAANQNLVNSGNAALSVAQYQSYQSQAEQLAQAAGLPPGFINKENIGVLAGANVSAAELSTRVNDAMTLAYNATPDQQAMFNQYFGTGYQQSMNANDPMAFGQSNQNTTSGGQVANGTNFQPTGHGPLTVGQIAAIALDPASAEPLIKQQITAAQIGGSFQTAGLSGVDAATALKLSQSGISAAQGQSAAASLGVYAPLQNALPGQTGATQVSADQLATGNLLGDTGALRAQQVAIESRSAPFKGGGGYVQSATGAIGTGSSKSSGAGQG